MTTRIGRRLRHKLHKQRARHHPIRTWRRVMLGWEFEQMCNFEASSCQLGAYCDLDGRWRMAPPRQEYIDIAQVEPITVSFEEFCRMPMPTEIKHTTYRLVRQRESRPFYEGRNRRTREIPAKMERVS